MHGYRSALHLGAEAATYPDPDEYDDEIDLDLKTSLVDLHPSENLPIMTLAQKQKMQTEIDDIHARLNEAEHKRQDTLIKN